MIHVLGVVLVWKSDDQWFCVSGSAQSFDMLPRYLLIDLSKQKKSVSICQKSKDTA